MTCRQAVGTIRKTPGGIISAALRDGSVGLIIWPPKPCHGCGRATAIGIIRLVDQQNRYFCNECAGEEETR